MVGHVDCWRSAKSRRTHARRVTTGGDGAEVCRVFGSGQTDRLNGHVEDGTI
jgi:hypothetical protein